MAVAALALFVVLVAVTRLRTRRRHSKAFGQEPHSLSWLWSYGLVTTGAISPVTALLSAEPLLDDTRVEVAGLVLAVVGIAATAATQRAMGDSWRLTPTSRSPWSRPARSAWSATRT